MIQFLDFRACYHSLDCEVQKMSKDMDLGRHTLLASILLALSTIFSSNALAYDGNVNIGQSAHPILDLTKQGRLQSEVLIKYSLHLLKLSSVLHLQVTERAASAKQEYRRLQVN